MIKELVRLVEERLTLVRGPDVPQSQCKACATEELEELLSIIEELAYIHDEEIR